MTDQNSQNTPQPLPVAPILPFQMKANLTEYRRRLGVLRFILAFGLTLLILARFGWASWLVFIAVVAVLILAILFVFAKRSLTVHSDRIEFKNAFGRVRQVTFEDISTVKVFMGHVEAGFGHAPRIIIGTKSNKPFFSATTLYWRAEDIDSLLAALKDKNVAIESYEELVLSYAIAKQFPEYVTVVEKHPIWISFGIVALIIVAIIVGLLVYNNL